MIIKRWKRERGGGSVFRTGLVLLGILVLISSSAFGKGANLRCDGTQGSGFVYGDSIGGTKVPEGMALQFISGNIAPPNPNASCLSGGNTLLGGLKQVGDGTGNPDNGPAGTFYVQDGTVDGTPLYVRVWSTGSLPTGISPSTKYGNSAVKSASSGAAPPTTYSIANFVLNYFADKPAAPAITSIETIGYDGATIKWSLNSQYEVTMETLSYGRNAAADDLGMVSVSGTTYTFPRLSLLPGVQYYVKVKAINYFGESSWSNIGVFTNLGTNFGGTASGLKITLLSGTVNLTWEGNAQTYEVWSADLNGSFAMVATRETRSWTTTLTSTTERYFQVRVPNGQGAPETVGWNRFILKKTGTTGINSISMPLNTKVPGNSPLIYTASDIKAQINSQSGNPNMFESIGGWDKATQTDFGYLKTGEGIDFDIEKGVGYQVSVLTDTDLVVVGQK